jgi:hypothetical protein
MALVLFNRMRVRRKMRPVDYIGANDTPECNECREEATAALAAIEAMGAVVVPVEVDDGMVEAGYEAAIDGKEWGKSVSPCEIYSAMIAASPYAKEPT